MTKTPQEFSLTRDAKLAYTTTDEKTLNRLRAHESKVVRSIIAYRLEGINAALDCYNEDPEHGDADQKRKHWSKITGGWLFPTTGMGGNITKEMLLSKMKAILGDVF